jgi:hypothetical protein
MLRLSFGFVYLFEMLVEVWGHGSIGRGLIKQV